MQYPVRNLDQAVEAVFRGKMSAKQAAETFRVPRSTIGRRVSVIQKEGPEAVFRSPVSSSSPAKSGEKRKASGKGLSMDERLREEIASILASSSQQPREKEKWEEEQDQLLATVATATRPNAAKLEVSS